MLRYILALILLLTITLPPALLSRAHAQDFSGFDFIIGPQVPASTSWFDQTEIDRAKLHGSKCPDVPPTDATALNDFVLLNYYDLPLTEYIAWKRTGDPLFLDYARKCADAWWQMPGWIDSGTQLDFANGKGPTPRHAGIGGLILRAIDGRPEMWDWITAYTRYEFDVWLGLRVNNSALYIGVREGAFMLHYAVWLAATHPDPAVRAEFLSKAETIAVNYYGRLQLSDGSWRWDDWDYTDADGGHLVGVTQPFMVGLLLNALIDLHRLSTNETVRTNVANQIVKGVRHLYFDGPFRNTLVPGLNGARWRDFFYFYHGGTSVNPTKYEFGGGSYTDVTWNADCGTNAACTIGIGRQAISTIFDAFRYAYLLTADDALRVAGEDLADAGFGGSDGYRGMADGTAKNYNQTYRMGGRYFFWMTQTPGSQPATSPTPTPTPTPTPVPSPSPSPSATPTPSPSPTPTPTPSPSPCIRTNPKGKCVKWF
jgi:hypothetical protein